MEIILSSTSGRPIYEQITLQIKEMIMKGDLAPGQALPSMRKLAWSYRLYLYRHAFRRNIRSRFLFKGNGISYGR